MISGFRLHAFSVLLAAAIAGAAAHAAADPCRQASPIVTPPASAPDAGGPLALFRYNRLVLRAPAGWRCAAEFGSGGAVMLLTPAGDGLSAMPEFDALEGPAVELLFLNGENSGRDEVADLESRFFPFRRAFRAEVDRIDRELGFPINRPLGFFRRDILLERDGRRVETITPAFGTGLGTVSSRLKPGKAPIASALFRTSRSGVESLALLHVRGAAGTGSAPVAIMRRIADDPAFEAGIAPD